MRSRFTRIAFAVAAVGLFVPLAPGAQVKTSIKKKEEAVASVEKHKAEIVALSDLIWGFAEVALEEVRSAKALADFAEAEGFTVERGVAGLPTAFVASYGRGRPVIGVLGEYDALPGLSQKPRSAKEALEPGAPGHGCGHNLLGAAALGAALAVKDLMAAGKLEGTVRFYGTPAEERVGGKVYMVREGLFKDLDVCLNWHPGDKTEVAVNSSQAIVEFIAEFSGRTAHAAADPWNGRSAVAALEMFTAGLNRMREFVKPTVRMHYSIVKGGDVPNVVPAYARLWGWLRDSKGSGAEQLLARARRIAEGAALMTDTEATITVQGGDWETLVNLAGANRPRQPRTARPGPVHAGRAGVRQGDPAGHGRRAGGPRRPGPALGRAEARSRRRLDGRRRRQLGRAHAGAQRHHGAPRRSLARLAGGGLLRDVHRAQGARLRRQGDGGDHGRPLRGPQGRPGHPGRVRGEDQGRRLQALHPGRPAAPAEALSRAAAGVRGKPRRRGNGVISVVELTRIELATS